ncbi:glycosyltransferase [Loktanella sp. S4079]|uniref:glycosyltransferase n=1 Tax=Loktanella sp. S4079 TaxID=579483 RepID=UPI0005FA54A5|nr:glycosyltransferase [Loktanella sp. S4079]KJZ17948.1 hypothetical protein TW80_16590 [Loktanella sp. S4079]
MKISFIVPWITKSRGGTENVGQLMANSMAEKGHEVNVYTFDERKQPSVWPLHNSLKLHFLPEGDDTKSNSQMTIALAEACPDLIVGLHMNRTLLRYTVAAQKVGVPVVLSEHIDPHFPKRLGVFTEDERLAAFTGATRIHLLTSAFKDTLPDYLQGKVNVIPNTVRAAENLCDPIGGDQRTIITVARLVPRKNLVQLIDEFSIIAKQHKNWTLQILGDGPMMSDLKARAKGRGIASQVEFLGHSDQPYSYLERAQIFVLPSLFEGFPMSSLEAMAHGMPLVGYSACNGINEQIVDGLNGRLAQRSLEKGCLAKCLDQLMRDDSLRKRMGVASKHRFDELYSNKIVFDAWEAMFKAAIVAGPQSVKRQAETSAREALSKLVNG